MVFKNPYGYLIKYFKIIHLFLTGLYVFLAFKVNSIYQYYDRFVKGTASKLEAISFVDHFYLVVIILSLIICVVIYILMRYKKKPRLLYIMLFLFYIVVWVMIRISYDGLNTIYVSVLETKTLRLYRDILGILVLFQYLSIFLVLVRGLGFDIKKFNFVQDLAELHLDEKDEEEIEFTLEENQSVGRKVRRRIRELRYYYLENKVFILIIVAVLLMFGIGTFFVHHEFVAKVYQEGETFSSEEYRFQVVNTYVTNRNANNKAIYSSDYSFVIVRMMIGVNHENRTFNTSNLILNVNHHSYSSSYKYASNFSDLGNVYKDNVIHGAGMYLFLFSVSNDDLNGSMTLEYAKSKTVKLSPVFLDEISDKETYQLGNRIDLNESAYGSGYFNITSYEIQKSFTYSYPYEVMGKMYNGSITISGENGVILHLLMDADLPSDYTYVSFLLNFGKLKCKISDEEKDVNFASRTPNNYKDGVYLAVDSFVENATSIWFELTIRNRVYIYTLK